MSVPTLRVESCCDRSSTAAPEHRQAGLRSPRAAPRRILAVCYASLLLLGTMSLANAMRLPRKALAHAGADHDAIQLFGSPRIVTNKPPETNADLKASKAKRSATAADEAQLFAAYIAQALEAANLSEEAAAHLQQAAFKKLRQNNDSSGSLHQRQQGGQPIAGAVGGSGSGSGRASSKDNIPWNPAAVDLTACMEDAADQKPFTVDDFLHFRPGRLRGEKALYSALPRSGPPVTVTLTATSERLPLLRGLCGSWTGPMSVAFYLPVIATGAGRAAAVAAAVAEVQTTFDGLEQLGACQADIAIYSELVADETAAQLFPINILRNNAMLLARTDLILLADADLLMGADLAASLSDPAEYQRALALCKAKKLLVVPVIEADLHRRSKEAATGKATAVAYVQQGKARGFKADRAEALHNSTDLERWAGATEPYAVSDPHERYEPWGMLYRPAMSFFDARFRGYGRNKVQHIHMHQHVLGFSFAVYHAGYMVHRPHDSTAARSNFLAGQRAAAIGNPAPSAVQDALDVFAVTSGMFEAQKAAGASFRPLLPPSFERCREKLPWWRIYGPEGEPLRGVTSVTSE